MKKILIIIFLILGISIFILGFDYKKNTYPRELYLVYLKGEVIGTIKDKEKLEKHINDLGESIKKQYKVEQVFAPNDLEIKKTLTYKTKLDSIEEIYQKIDELEPFTIRGYQFTIANDSGESKVYVTNLEVFEKALSSTFATFVGKENYQLYLDEQQVPIENIGSYIDNITHKDTIKYKETNISIEEDIYTEAETLSKFLLFGTTEDQGTYIVQPGDTIESVAFKNEISIEEFLISNPQFSSKNNLLFPNQVVVIGITNPKVRIEVKETTVEIADIEYKTEYKYDPNKTVGYEEVIQKGEKGSEKVTRNVETVNGNIIAAPVSNQEVLKPAINEIVIRGEKQAPSVGNPKLWSWPTGPGWIITQDWEWRINPINYRREHHQAIDIAIGYGAHIYAANNGTVIITNYESGYGNYVTIDHNNGYYTVYSHLSKILVKPGQIVPSGSLIGYMGSTGMSTGPHLHFEVWIGKPHAGGYKTNPWNVLKR